MGHLITLEMPEAYGYEAYKAEVTPSPQANGKRPFITKWRGEAGKTIKIAAVGTYTLTWYNEATPNERHTEQVTVTTQMNKYEMEYCTPHILTPPHRWDLRSRGWS